jgi:transposase
MDRATAPDIFDGWYAWAIRSRHEPIKGVARMLKRHLEGVLNAVATGITNARIEGMNATIQGLKRSARGFRSRDRFRTAIYFHLGALDLYPACLAHTKS